MIRAEDDTRSGEEDDDGKVESKPRGPTPGLADEEKGTDTGGEEEEWKMEGWVRDEGRSGERWAVGGKVE